MHGATMVILTTYITYKIYNRCYKSITYSLLINPLCHTKIRENHVSSLPRQLHFYGQDVGEHVQIQFCTITYNKQHT